MTKRWRDLHELAERSAAYEAQREVARQQFMFSTYGTRLALLVQKTPVKPVALQHPDPTASLTSEMKAEMVGSLLPMKSEQKRDPPISSFEVILELQEPYPLWVKGWPRKLALLWSAHLPETDETALRAKIL